MPNKHNSQYTSLLSQTISAELAKWLDVGKLVPKRYAVYHPVIRDGLLFFLQNLSFERQQTIAQEQMGLSPKTSLIERIYRLLHRCPSLHKLGQVLAHDRSLAPELLERLQSLETMPAITPLSEITRIIRKEIGYPPELELAPQALAEASVAVILPFTWTQAKEVNPVQGVFKVLKPGVEELLQEELLIWTKLGQFLEDRCFNYGLPRLKYRETFQQIRRLLLQEIRLDLEQANLKQAADFFADTEEIWIPKTLPFSTPNLTAMEYVPGCKVTEASDLSENKKCQLAETIILNLIAKPMWNENRLSFFHADPHGGNMILAPDGRLAILDWSLLTNLDKDQRSGLVQIVLSALNLDQASICRALESLSSSRPDHQALQSVVAEETARLRSGILPGFNWLIGLMDRAAKEANINFPDSLALFRKALHTLLGVLADISESCSLDPVLISSGIGQFINELPRRIMSYVHCRDFGTHISTADILGFIFSSPLLPLKFWNSWWQELSANQKS